LSIVALFKTKLGSSVYSVTLNVA